MISKLIAKTFSNEMIIDNSFNKTHNDESMLDIFNHIMQNPDIEHIPGKGTIIDMVYHGKKIGWYDTARMMGDIDQKAYDEISKAYDDANPLMEETEFNELKNIYNANKDAILKKARTEGLEGAYNELMDISDKEKNDGEEY